jgi:hypothetical protein
VSKSLRETALAAPESEGFIPSIADDRGHLKELINLRARCERLEAALERFNLIRDISGQPVLSLDEFVVRLLGDGLSTQEAKFSRLAALAGKAA